MAEWEANKAALEELGTTIIAVSVDNQEHAQEVKDRGLSFTVAYGATKADGDLIGSWWSEDRGGYIQPSDFLLGRGGVVLGAMYASGPVGRMGADEAIRLITNRENRRREEEGEAAN